MVKNRNLTNEKKKLSVKVYIALAVFIETAVNALFAVLFNEFLRFFYSDYAHLTVWGDIVAIVSVIFSFIIYDSFAHVAYHDLKSRIMFLGVVYVASKAASIVHYLVGIVAESLSVNSGDTVQNITLVLIEIAVDIIVAAWLMGYFERKLIEDENKKTA